MNLDNCHRCKKPLDGDKVPYDLSNIYCLACLELRRKAEFEQHQDELARRPPTLRDRFAMAALTGIMAMLTERPSVDSYDNIAKVADEIADAMMKRRK